MYHLYDGDKLVMNVWQSVKLNNINIYAYDDSGEIKDRTLVDEDSDEKIMQRIMEFWEKVTSDKWTRTSFNNDVKFVL